MPSVYPETYIDQYGKPPTDQTFATLTWVMIDPSLTGGRWEHELFVKPEDLTYTHPTRATVIQTLGGAFVDDFGEGLTDIVLSGHTGWHYARTSTALWGRWMGRRKSMTYAITFFRSTTNTG